MSNFVDVLAEGDLHASLVALRDRLAEELAAGRHAQDCTCECDSPVGRDGRAISAVAKELRSVLLEIDKIPGVEEDDPLDAIAGNVADELAPRRAARQPGAAAP